VLMDALPYIATKPASGMAQLPDLLVGLGEPPYRVHQIERWVYQRLAFDPAEMTDLPTSLRSVLMERLQAVPLAVIRETRADAGQTRKALFRLEDSRSVEAVLMCYDASARGRARNTVCVSSQVGCAIGCPFCATGLGGFTRNLRADEILGQVLWFARELRLSGESERITNVVFMGQGEPLANLAQVWSAVETLNAVERFGLGARHVTISTSGLAPRIAEVADHGLQVGLAVSLHAPDDELRDRLVPVNRRYPLAELLDACRYYIGKTGRRVSFEYTLMRGVNDSPVQATLLANLLRGLLAHVNLIQMNPVDGSDFRAPSQRAALDFERVLRTRGIPCTLRATRGREIDGACGQLRAHALKDGIT
jgi:23S rRNA (adenine2503-C2)-methyltransferase